MAEKLIAVGTVRAGVPEDAKGTKRELLSQRRVFRPGEEVKGLPQEELDALVESGAVMKQHDYERRQAPGEPSEMEAQHAAAVEAKDAEIQALKDRVAELEATKTSTPPTARK